MSLIGIGNAHNTSAQMRARFRMRREENKRKIETARTQYLERIELRKHSDFVLEGMMSVLYDSIIFVDEHPFMDKNYFLDDITDLGSYLREQVQNQTSEVLAKRLGKLEEMVSLMQDTLYKTNDEDKIKSYLKKSIPALYSTFLGEVQGKFGQEIYEKL